jgi:hypothetical protein
MNQRSTGSHKDKSIIGDPKLGKGSSTSHSMNSKTSNASSSPRIQLNNDVFGARRSSLSLIREEGAEADEDPPIGLISLAAGDRPESNSYNRKMT